MEAGEAAGQGGERLTEDQARAAMEEQLAKVRVHDLLLESVVGILNLTARRIAKPDERDLEQAKLGIDAVRAVVDLLAPEPQKAVRDALAELQMLYAREAAGGGAPASEDEAPPDAPPAAAPPAQEPPPRRAEPPPRLWTPPGAGG